MLKLKLQYFGHLMPRRDSLEKDPDTGKDWRQEEKGMTEDEMAGWHHWLDGHKFGQAPGIGDAMQPSHPLSSPSPAFNLSQHQGIFQLVSSLHQVYWTFSFNISPSNEYSELISFRMDWLYLHAVQGTLRSLLQHHSSKASILQCSAFFIVQLSHPYMTTGKTIALTRWTSNVS